MMLQPRYVVNQVTAGDYDCPCKVLKFLTDLHAAFRMLNLRNDFLRKKFDGERAIPYKLDCLFFFLIYNNILYKLHILIINIKVSLVVTFSCNA